MSRSKDLREHDEEWLRIRSMGFTLLFLVACLVFGLGFLLHFCTSETLWAK